MVDRTFIAAVDAACRQAFGDIGFQCPRKHVRYLAINDDFLGWVGLNKGRHENHLRLNPYIGLHCVPVMTLCDEIASQRYKKGDLATVALHLGEVCPDEDAFIFSPGVPVEPEARRLAGLVNSAAGPWMRANASYKALIRLLDTRTSSLGGYPERMAAALFLSGQNEDARQFVEALVIHLESTSVSYQDFADRFAAPFLEYMDNQKA